MCHCSFLPLLHSAKQVMDWRPVYSWMLFHSKATLSPARWVKNMILPKSNGFDCKMWSVLACLLACHLLTLQYKVFPVRKWDAEITYRSGEGWVCRGLLAIELSWEQWVMLRESCKRFLLRKSIFSEEVARACTQKWITPRMCNVDVTPCMQFQLSLCINRAMAHSFHSHFSPVPASPSHSVC